MGRVRITRIIARLNVGGPAVHVINLTATLDPACFENHLIVGRPGPDEGDMGYLAAHCILQDTPIRRDRNRVVECPATISERGSVKRITSQSHDAETE